MHSISEVLVNSINVFAGLLSPQLNALLSETKMTRFMFAAHATAYGSSGVLKLKMMPQPSPGPGQVLIRVAHAGVTTADWRLRAALFPGMFALPARLIFGITRPRNPVLGSAFAGHVVALGGDVSGFSEGQAVFGFAPAGAHAEYLCLDAAGCVLPVPATLPLRDAAALPFGALSALVFLRDFAHLQPGQKVLIVGASGGVGAYATQIARAMGGQVTGVASAEHAPFLFDLGAQETLDYQTLGPGQWGRGFDLVFDVVGALSFRQARVLLSPAGLFVPLNWGHRDLFWALWARLWGGPQVKVGVSGDTKADLEVLAEMVREGTLRALVDSRFPFDQIRTAHDHVETRHRRGTVLLDMPEDAESVANMCAD